MLGSGLVKCVSPPFWWLQCLASGLHACLLVCVPSMETCVSMLLDCGGELKSCPCRNCLISGSVVTIAKLPRRLYQTLRSSLCQRALRSVISGALTSSYTAVHACGPAQQKLHCGLHLCWVRATIHETPLCNVCKGVLWWDVVGIQSTSSIP